jgi:hypothetical protein
MASRDSGSAGETDRGGGKKVCRVEAEGCSRRLIELPRDLQSMSALELLQGSRAVRSPHSVCWTHVSSVLFKPLLHRHDARLAKRLCVGQG